ncbi:adenylate kinase [Agromyces rhizosphaerae]|uniref:Adenylate kinase n=1 Tax=Agromyces rhizosphaerae TaxID=88374 RepID=A0A9W6D314_9MICO|nr:ATP-binding protein [Agromyces rhizosphaerae]GLI28703.1 adenylate kinase [Agromyces rhizosphaerae]
MPERLAPAVAVRRLAALLRAEPSATVLVDGPSGAGKSTFADAVLDAAGARRVQLLRLDSVYPGWDGLAAGSAAVRRGVLAPRVRGGAGTWRRWDWAHDRPAESHLLRPGIPLLVEGCGAFTLPGVLPDPRVVRVWVVAGEEARKRRALERDAGGFDPHWAQWERQWRAYVSAAAPAPRADLVVAGA